MKRILSLLLVCCIILTGCTSAEQAEAQAETLKHVYTEITNTEAYSDTITLSGNIVPTQIVKLSFKIPGVVSDVMVNEGDFVTVGQNIARMDSGDYNISVKAAQAEWEAYRMQIDTEIPSKINQAKAQYDLTKISYDRVTALLNEGTASQSQMDEVSAKLIVDENTYKQALDAKAIAETKLKQAAAALEYANSNVQDTVIQSPIDGVILQKIIGSGEAASAGYPVVAIGQTDSIWVEVGVTDEYINSIYTGQEANVYVYGIDKTFKGTVAEVNSLADTNTRTFPVKVVLDNSVGELKSGMIAKVDLSLKNSPKLLIPISSVIHLSEGSVVFVYSNETHIVSKKIIVTGNIIDDKIEVLNGLDSEEEIVVEGQFVLRDGDKVTKEEMSK